ncbi:MAG: bifunctional precorrin-2 dehydrogenase/sirohydrochlorin ferrochelatase [Clostridia bacterium]|jgi:precorrin-2 dehydrogenase/sirohydrochlorin ferrochelatase|nr:bifunctional precorrin-2 dehydrogenase/sirohydrochlorin ferrochelatase [Clostridia bacterium]
MANLYPVYVNLVKQKCLVVGGGEVAERKVISLVECDATVTVISPECTQFLRQLAEEGKIDYIQRRYDPGDLEDAFLVISATDNQEVNKLVASSCFSKGILVNIVDVPDLCNFFVPSVVRRGDLTISISTGGKSPLLASKLRKELEGQFGEEYQQYLEIMGRVRQQVLTECDDPSKRKAIFQRLVESDILQLLREGKEFSAKERVNQCLSLLWD